MSSNSNETKVRATSAIRAMKALGIMPDKVKPVLKKLLHLYNKNWELIEEENYRALIDAIFESEDEQVTVEASPMQTVNYDEAVVSMNTLNRQAEHSLMNIVRAPNEDELEEEHETEALARPLKRLRHKFQDGQSSSPLIKPKDEPKELPIVNDRSQEPVSSKILRGQERGNNSEPTGVNRSEQTASIEIQAPTHPTRSAPPKVPSKRKRPLNESSSHAPHLEGPRADVDIVLSAKQKSSATPLIKIKDEPVTDDVPPSEAPPSVIRPDQSNGGNSSSWNGTIRGNSHLEPSRQSAREPETIGQRNNGKPVTVIDEDASAIEVASSPLRDVKILISCNAALQRPGFQVPSLEAVLKAVEDKCLKSYKILDPNFSVMNIMKETCQSFLEFGSKSNTEQPNTLDVTLAIDLMNKLSANCSSNFEVPLPDTPPIPHCGGNKDGAQSNGINGGDPTGSNGEEEENAGQTNNMSLVVVQQADVMTPVHVDDVAKGHEKVVIPLVNEVDNSLPPSFYYLPQNTVFENANVNFTLASIGDSLCITCSQDCYSSVITCGCAIEGKFWYTEDGYVKEDILNECISIKRDPKKHVQFFCNECPLEKSIRVGGTESCKGHQIKKFIKECWIKCGCHKQCGNRVVQRGITRKLQVFMTSEGKGWGLRTLEDMPKGAFVCEYVGEILTLSEFFGCDLRSSKREKGSCPVLLDANWSGEEEQKEEIALCLDGAKYGNVARFINHRCYDSNLVEIPVQVEIPEHHYYRVAFFTTREVKSMEELTWDYGIDFEDNHHLLKTFKCLCGSTFCRQSVLVRKYVCLFWTCYSSPVILAHLSSQFSLTCLPSLHFKHLNLLPVPV